MHRIHCQQDVDLSTFVPLCGKKRWSRFPGTCGHEDAVKQREAPAATINQNGHDDIFLYRLKQS